MNKKDILELKRRLSKDNCTFTRMCGCYVDAGCNKITEIGETFLNLEDMEFFKYLEIAKKVLSGKLRDNLLELEFSGRKKAEGGMQQLLLTLRDSKLKDEALLERFYNAIIDTYDYAGHYLILIFHDSYDVIKKTKDGQKLEESEEVYEYLLCAVCPVTLSKPGLGYREDENRIGARVRDWVVGMPDMGFVFPAFTDRSTDTGAALFYSRDPKDPQEELMEDFTGAYKETSAKKRKYLQKIINDQTFDNNTYRKIQYIMQITVETDQTEANIDLWGTIQATPENMEGILKKSGMDESMQKEILASYRNGIKEYPMMQDLISEKDAAAGRIIMWQEQFANKTETMEEYLRLAAEQLEHPDANAEQLRRDIMDFLESEDER